VSTPREQVPLLQPRGLPLAMALAVPTG